MLELRHPRQHFPVRAARKRRACRACLVFFGHSLGPALCPLKAEPTGNRDRVDKHGVIGGKLFRSPIRADVVVVRQAVGLFIAQRGFGPAISAASDRQSSHVRGRTASFLPAFDSEVSGFGSEKQIVASGGVLKVGGYRFDPWPEWMTDLMPLVLFILSDALMIFISALLLCCCSCAGGSVRTGGQRAVHANLPFGLGLSPFPGLYSSCRASHQIASTKNGCVLVAPSRLAAGLLEDLRVIHEGDPVPDVEDRLDDVVSVRLLRVGCMGRRQSGFPAFFFDQDGGGVKVATTDSRTGPVIGCLMCWAAICPTVRSKLTVSAGV